MWKFGRAEKNKQAVENRLSILVVKLKQHSGNTWKVRKPKLSDQPVTCSAKCTQSVLAVKHANHTLMGVT